MIRDLVLLVRSEAETMEKLTCAMHHGNSNGV